MKALVLAAGKGTRLGPLTEKLPKALVAIGETTLLENAVETLAKQGFDELVINIHHQGEEILKYLELHQNFGLKIDLSDEREQLLDTGGAIKKAARFFDDSTPFLVYNVDVLTNLNLKSMVKDHIKSGALATLAVRHRESSRYLLIDEEGRLRGWKNVRTGESRGKIPAPGVYDKVAFSGIHVIHPDLFDFFPAKKEVFSIIDLYLELSANQLIRTYVHDNSLWMDAGKAETFEQAESFLDRINRT